MTFDGRDRGRPMAPLLELGLINPPGRLDSPSSSCSVPKAPFLLAAFGSGCSWMASFAASSMMACRGLMERWPELPPCPLQPRSLEAPADAMLECLWPPGRCTLPPCWKMEHGLESAPPAMTAFWLAVPLRQLWQMSKDTCCADGARCCVGVSFGCLGTGGHAVQRKMRTCCTSSIDTQ